MKTRVMLLVVAALAAAGCASVKQETPAAPNAIKASERDRSDVHWMMRDMEDRVERQFTSR